MEEARASVRLSSNETTKEAGETDLEQREELRILDTHVLDRVKERDPLGEPLLDLGDGLGNGLSSLKRAKVLGHEDSNVAEGGDGGEEDGNDKRLALLARRARKDVGRSRVAILLDGGAAGAG